MYELPESVPSIPLAPAKPVVDQAPEPDFEMLDNANGDMDGGKAAAGKKRAAEDDVEAEGGGKRRKVEVIEADDSDFEIM